MKIVADENIPFLKGVLEPFANVIYLPGRDITPYHVRDADVLIVRTRTKCGKNLLEGSRVQVIASATIGYDHIDTEFCDSKNIRWFNAPGCNSASVEQYVTAALFKIARLREMLLSELTIGIIGVGHVGSRVANIAGILGMNVLLNDPPRQRTERDQAFCSLETILEQADMVSLHVPLNLSGRDKTFHMVDRNFLERSVKPVILINTSRGEVVNTEGLKQMIHTGQCREAILDVWENEPHIDREMLSMSFLGTPHIAGYSADGKANGTAQCVRNISRIFDLGMDDWYPAQIPGTRDNVLRIDCDGRGQEDIMGEAVRFTYDIAEDDAKLKKDPDSFEQYRGNYPVRREATYYALKIFHDREGVSEKLARMGFSIIHDYCF